MQIHILRENETLEDLEKLYSINKDKIILANGLYKDNKIIMKKALVIPFDDKKYVNINNELNIVDEFNFEEIWGIIDSLFGINAFIYADVYAQIFDKICVINYFSNEILYCEDYSLYACKLNNKKSMAVLKLANERLTNISNRFKDLKKKGYDEFAVFPDCNSIAFNKLAESVNFPNVFIEETNIKSMINQIHELKNNVILLENSNVLSLKEFVEKYENLTLDINIKRIIPAICLKNADIDIGSVYEDFYDKRLNLAFFYNEKKEKVYFENCLSLYLKLKYLKFKGFRKVCFYPLNVNVPYLKYIVR